MPIYMHYEGVSGRITDRYKGWIELQSAQLGVHQHGTSPSGRGTSREASVPSISEIVVTKYIDDSSTALYREALYGKTRKVTIHFVRATPNTKAPGPYLAIELESTQIVNYSVSGHGGDNHDRPLEALSLNFLKFKYSSTPLETMKESKAVQDKATWDLALVQGS